MTAVKWLPTNQSKVGDFTMLADPERVEELDSIVSDLPGVINEGRQVLPRGITVQDYIAGDLARIQYCSCFDGASRSITVRTNTKSKAFPEKISCCREYLQYSGYQPSPQRTPGFLASKWAVCRAVLEALRFDRPEKLQSPGLLVIAGGTGSLKTVLAQGLIQMRLERLMGDWLDNSANLRKPHLVTCEDDIEAYLYDLRMLQPVEQVFLPNPKPACFEPGLWLCRADLPDYTPRRLGRDTDGLEEAVDDALRMKPAIFYGGEVRHGDDWKQLYRLALSHLVVVTTHASSLVSTFALLQKHLEVKTSAQRSELASALYGVVHMKPGEMEGDVWEVIDKEAYERGAGHRVWPWQARRARYYNSIVHFLLPAVWVSTPSAVAAFTSDGAASLVPEFVPIEPKMTAFCIGRASFVNKLQELSPQVGAPKKAWDAGKVSDFFNSTESTRCPVDHKWWLEPFIDEIKPPQFGITAGCQEKLLQLATNWDLIGE